jgi:hypothetical protein
VSGMAYRAAGISKNDAFAAHADRYSTYGTICLARKPRMVNATPRPSEGLEQIHHCLRAVRDFMDGWNYD